MGAEKIEIQFWYLFMKYSLLLCRRWQDIHRGLTFFFHKHEFCTISIASTLIIQQHRPRRCRSKHCCKVTPRLYQCRPVVVSAPAWFVTAGREVFHQSPGKFSSDDGDGGGGCKCSMLNGRRTAWLGISSQHAEFRHWSANKVGSQRFSDCTNNILYCKTHINNLWRKVSRVSDLWNCWKDSLSFPFLWNSTFNLFVFSQLRSSSNFADVCVWYKLKDRYNVKLNTMLVLSNISLYIN